MKHQVLLSPEPTDCESKLAGASFLKLMAMAGRLIINASQKEEWVNRNELSRQIGDSKLRQRFDFAVVRLAMERLIVVNEQDSMLVKPANALSDFIAEVFDGK